MTGRKRQPVKKHPTVQATLPATYEKREPLDLLRLRLRRNLRRLKRTLAAGGLKAS